MPLTKTTETRLPPEKKWYALTGRVVDLRVEADGDVHIALKDATGGKPGRVNAEVPVGREIWCKSRKKVFSWTTQKFPFNVKKPKVLPIREHHVITVTGKAFFDVDHAPANHSNRRTDKTGYAAWEIHPVMALRVVQ